MVNPLGGSHPSYSINPITTPGEQENWIKALTEILDALNQVGSDCKEMSTDKAFEHLHDLLRKFGELLKDATGKPCTPERQDLYNKMIDALKDIIYSLSQAEGMLLGGDPIAARQALNTILKKMGPGSDLQSYINQLIHV